MIDQEKNLAKAHAHIQSLLETHQPIFQHERALLISFHVLANMIMTHAHQILMQADFGVDDRLLRSLNDRIATQLVTIAHTFNIAISTGYDVSEPGLDSLNQLILDFMTLSDLSQTFTLEPDQPLLDWVRNLNEQTKDDGNG